ncbi:TPA: type VI secretion system contractile sheath small subunit [Klebsiella aerogenes]|nr:type VI secretion system contractile sheath small subunit [Klebsiella aerogenes]
MIFFHPSCGSPTFAPLVTDFSNGQESAPLSGCGKVNLNKNNFGAVLSEYSPKVNLTVKNILADNGKSFPKQQEAVYEATGLTASAQAFICRKTPASEIPNNFGSLRTFDLA